MPATSKSQQRLFGMAWAVRKGELPRSEVSKEILDIADGELSDKELKLYASTKHKGLKESLEEALDRG